MFAALSLGACDAPGKVVIEGNLPAQFKLVGAANSYTHRDSWLCKAALFQSPHAKYERRDVTFTRVDSARYRVEIDLSQLPYGGFCDWRVIDVNLAVEDVRNEFSHAAAVSLAAVNAGRDAMEGIAFAPKLALACKQSFDRRHIDCRKAHTLFTELRSDVKLQLDISYENALWPDDEAAQAVDEDRK